MPRDRKVARAKGSVAHLAEGGESVLEAETAQRLQGFRKQSAALRGDLQAARKAWQKAAMVLAKKRRHPKRGAE